MEEQDDKIMDRLITYIGKHIGGFIKLLTSYFENKPLDTKANIP